MKTKKILAITLSCLLLIGAMVGFTVSAAEGDPTVAISGVNVSYESAIKLVYTLDTTNIPTGGAGKVVFSFDENVTVPTGEALNEDAYEYVNGLTVYGNDEAVFSNGFAPADMTKNVYAVPVIVDEDGIAVAVGAKVKSSIYDYFMGRINSGESTAEQLELYVAALDFGGFVQEAKKITEGADPVGGHYANEYYQLKTIDENGTLTTETYNKPTSVEIVAPKGNTAGKLFEGFVDNNGVAYEDANFNKLTVKLDKIGTSYVEYVYGDTNINVEGITGTADAPAELVNPDVAAVIKGGAEYYLDGEITLAEGAVATLNFMVDDTTVLGAVNFSEAEGIVTVSDGISTFTMPNGANLKIEYTVISTANSTGAIFYYVDNAYVAHSNIDATSASSLGLANTAFSKVVASATAGEIAVTNVIVGANDGIITFTHDSYVTVTYEYDEEIGKYYKWNHPTEGYNDTGTMKFDAVGTYDANGADDTKTVVFETKMMITGTYFAATSGRNAIPFNLQTRYYADSNRTYTVLSQNFAFSPNRFHWGTAAYNNEDTEEKVTGTNLNSTIAAGTWFDFKLEHKGGNGGYIKMYVNGQLVFEKANGTSAFETLTLSPMANCSGSISMADVKLYTK